MRVMPEIPVTINRKYFLFNSRNYVMLFLQRSSLLKFNSLFNVGLNKALEAFPKIVHL